MIAADLAAAWQFSKITAAGERLNHADETSLAVIRVRLDVYTFRDTLAALVRVHDADHFATNAASLRKQLEEDVAKAHQFLSASAIIEHDRTVLSALESVHSLFARQLESVVNLFNRE